VEEDQDLAASYCDFWTSNVSSEILDILPWVPFLNDAQIDFCLEAVFRHGHGHADDATGMLLEALCVELSRRMKPHSTRSNQAWIPVLISAVESLEAPSPYLRSALQNFVLFSLPFGILPSDPSDAEIASDSLLALVEKNSHRWIARFSMPIKEHSHQLEMSHSLSSLQSYLSCCAAYKSAEATESLAAAVVCLITSSTTISDAYLLSLCTMFDLVGIDTNLLHHPTIPVPWIGFLFNAVISRSAIPGSRIRAAHILLSLLAHPGGDTTKDAHVAYIQSAISLLHFGQFFRSHFLLFILKLVKSLDSSVMLLKVVVDRGLQLSVRHFAEQVEDSESFLLALEVFGTRW
jgi:hypothetical protein